MKYLVIKRDGSAIEFDLKKISNAIVRAFEATNKPYDDNVIDLISIKVTGLFPLIRFLMKRSSPSWKTICGCSSCPNAVQITTSMQERTLMQQMRSSLLKLLKRPGMRSYGKISKHGGQTQQNVLKPKSECSRIWLLKMFLTKSNAISLRSMDGNLQVPAAADICS